MPASFLKRHRTICEVLEEIRAVSVLSKDAADIRNINTLVDEAKTYAEAMSAKLVEYKHEKEEGR
jgi:hypothetical protein